MIALVLSMLIFNNLLFALSFERDFRTSLAMHDEIALDLMQEVTKEVILCNVLISITKGLKLIIDMGTTQIHCNLYSTTSKGYSSIRSLHVPSPRALVSVLSW